jgi:hypothetical protein
MNVPAIAKVAFTSEDRVRDVIGNFNADGSCTLTDSSWLNRIEAQFTALRYFALDGTGHATHHEQAAMIRRYLIWRNNHACYERLPRCRPGVAAQVAAAVAFGLPCWPGSTPWPR